MVVSPAVSLVPRALTYRPRRRRGRRSAAWTRFLVHLALTVLAALAIVQIVSG